MIITISANQTQHDTRYTYLKPPNDTLWFAQKETVPCGQVQSTWAEHLIVYNYITLAPLEMSTSITYRAGNLQATVGQFSVPGGCVAATSPGSSQFFNVAYKCTCRKWEGLVSYFTWLTTIVQKHGKGRNCEPPRSFYACSGHFAGGCWLN